MSEIIDTQPNPARPGGAGKSGKLSGVLFGVLGFLVLLALGIMIGYYSGVGSRLDAQGTQVTQQLQDQFNLGNQAMDAGQYEIARQHFQFVIDHNPNYPGVQAAYTLLMERIQTSPTPTLTETPTPSLTPDLRGADAVYKNIQDLLASNPKTADDWSAVIVQLDSLRKIDPTYHAAEIDGDYYTALRQRGVAEIFAQPCQNINLEGGIYDLTLAERFGPLDSYAVSLRTYSRLYISGASFWEIDWLQAQNYFGQVKDALPNLMDSSCQTSTQRWAFASIKYGDQLLASGDVCAASTQYANASGISIPLNVTAQPTIDYANNKCNPPPPPAPKATETPTGGTPAGGETPTETPTQ